MIVRKMEARDLWGVVSLIKAFFAEGADKWGYGYNQNDCEQTFFVWLNNSRTVNFVLEHEEELIGMQVGVTAPHLLNLRQWYYYEHLWYVRPEFRDRGCGLRLLAHTEAELRLRGIKHIIMGNQKHFKNDYFERLYRRLGFEAVETLWIKELKDACTSEHSS